MGGINEATEVGGLLQVVQIDYHQEYGGLRRIPERAYRKNERPE